MLLRVNCILGTVLLLILKHKKFSETGSKLYILVHQGDVKPIEMSFL
jgi:hypothetical protein